ncbi:hypothetical protein DesyoDRAFT_2665 [Desulfosporosinus youngiae DSM 17734]|uniref:Uncharacterized protein n=1 Tax=Desulfosporosinus youngiae DSM 17734 TaxID=768710 RepID=H5Y450_9FIRM|nr:hypothetical protein DesyoDRAFT_2665 [Desulfosporosinus youngiae DSM 17734]
MQVKCVTGDAFESLLLSELMLVSKLRSRGPYFRFREKNVRMDCFCLNRADNPCAFCYNFLDNKYKVYIRLSLAKGLFETLS